MTTDDPFPGEPGPHDLEAEQAVLGAMLLSPAAAEECSRALTASDFARPAHRRVFAAIKTLAADGGEADKLTVAARLDTEGHLGQAGGPGYLAVLAAAPPSAHRAGHYAAIVRDRAVRRRLLEAGRDITTLAAGPGDAGGLTERAVRITEAVRAEGQDGEVTTPTITEFLDSGSDEYDWLIPGLLERGDRMMLTGSEGLGKSTLLDQFAVTAAAGIHLLTGEPQPPCRVLVVDCENGARRKRRNLRPLVLQAAALGFPVAEANLWVEVREEVMDLAADKDVSWLMRLVAAIRPDIVSIGPLKKLAPRALNDDTDAAPVLAALDMIRAREACVLVEAHAGHGLGPGGRRDMRPRGSSAFLGWPEFGYGLRPSASAEDGDGHLRVADLVGWRGDREERDWPEQLISGGTWPWSAYNPWVPSAAARGNGGGRSFVQGRD